MGGDASYTLYLSHTFVLTAAALIWKKAGIGLPWIGFAVGIALSIAAALLFYRWAERPVTERLQRLAFARPSPPAQTVAP